MSAGYRKMLADVCEGVHFIYIFGFLSKQTRTLRLAQLGTNKPNIHRFILKLNSVLNSIPDFVNDEHFLKQMTDEKFDLALVHHLDTCPISVAHAAGVGFCEISGFGHNLRPRG